MKETLSILWIKDDRRGHLSKVEGTLYALSFFYTLDIEEIEVRWRPGFIRQIIHRCISKKFPLPFFFFLKEYKPKPVDLVISSGGKTEWANARLAHINQAQNIYFGSVRTKKPLNYSLLPIITGKNEALPYLGLDLIPSKLTAERCHKKAKQELAHLRERYIALIIGGDGSGCTWKEADWHYLARNMITLAKLYNCKLLVTTSPRTGNKAEKILHDYFNADPNVALVIWYSENVSTPSLQALIGKSETIFVTEDSSTMVNEALFSARPVYTLRPPKSKLDDQTESILSRLEHSCYIKRLSTFELESVDFITHYDWSTISKNWHEKLGLRLIEHLNLMHRIRK